MTKKLFDVVEVNLKTKKVKMIGQNKTQKNADAIEIMALMRRGCDDDFFAVVQQGKYKDGDIYTL